MRKLSFSTGCLAFAGMVLQVTPSARAATITQSSVAPHRVRVSADAAKPATRRLIGAPPANGCVLVTPTNQVDYVLEEPGAVNEAPGPGTVAVTAAMTITASGTYQKMNVDATGCDIGIYVPPNVKNVKIEDVTVHDATRAGIVVDGSQCTTLLGDQVYNIGDHPQSGDQYGFGIVSDYAKNLAVDYVTAATYQKTGFNIRHSTGSINLNTVTGDGPIGVPLAALNGFEFLNDNLSAIFGNRTLLNQYTGPIYGGSGYLLFCTSVQKHVLTSSDQKKFAQTWQNLEAFDDIAYYFDPTDRCNGT